MNGPDDVNVEREGARKCAMPHKGHAPRRVRTGSRGATEPEVGTVGAEHSLFVVHNSPIRRPGCETQTSRT